MPLRSTRVFCSPCLSQQQSADDRPLASSGSRAVTHRVALCVVLTSSNNCAGSGMISGYVHVISPDVRFFSVFLSPTSTLSGDSTRFPSPTRAGLRRRCDRTDPLSIYPLCVPCVLELGLYVFELIPFDPSPSRTIPACRMTT